MFLAARRKKNASEQSGDGDSAIQGQVCSGAAAKTGLPSAHFYAVPSQLQK
jgi:hypothetical protein